MEKKLTIRKRFYNPSTRKRRGEIKRGKERNKQTPEDEKNKMIHLCAAKKMIRG